MKTMHRSPKQKQYEPHDKTQEIHLCAQRRLRSACMGIRNQMGGRNQVCRQIGGWRQVGRQICGWRQVDSQMGGWRQVGRQIYGWRQVGSQMGEWK